MTRDEHRKACFKAMGHAYVARVAEGNWEFQDLIIACFDALHGVARIVPIEVTEEIAAARRSSKWALTLNLIWRDMVVAGDLTNPPEVVP